ncbi:unnamed protein product, partial [Meganyctiphanes norvegica]
FNGSDPILAVDAVKNMSFITDMEMAVMLDQVVGLKAEEYLQSSQPSSSDYVYWIIGGSIAIVCLLVLCIWLGCFIYKRKNSDSEVLHSDSQTVTPRSQFTDNAFSGHVNLAYAQSRDEKV